MVTVTVTGTDTILVSLDNVPRSILRASVRAMNRGMTSGRSVMAKAVSADLKLKQKDVRDALVLKQANITNPSASLAASLKRIPLVDFGARGPEPSRAKGRGVTYNVGRSKSLVPDAFLAVMASGHRGVFTRKGNKRLPIKELFGPSLGRVFITYKPAATARALEMFQKNFGHELEVETNGFIKAGPDEQGAPADE